jgi:hypothetical protein
MDRNIYRYFFFTMMAITFGVWYLHVTRIVTIGKIMYK